MINIRLVRKKDSKDIFEWRNDEITRKLSHKTDVVGWNGHCKWLIRSLPTEE